MAAFNSKSPRHYKLRSVSLPTRSHPSTIRIEQVVNKLKTLEASPSSSSKSKADTICNSLLGLAELYEAIDQQLLALRPTQQALLTQHQNELVEESVTYIDVCNNTRDAVMQMKQGIRGLQSSFRRNKLGELSIEIDIADFLCSRKNLHKEISNSLAKLKNTENRGVVPLQPLNTEDHQLSAVLKALTEASLLTISTFSTLLIFLCVPVMKSRPARRWSLVSKLMHKGALLACEGQRNNTNELEDVDIALGDLCKDAGKEKIKSAHRKLEALETILESLENRLELLFRHLIRTRVSLLNLFSQ